MSTNTITAQLIEASPRRTARIAGVLYLLVFVTGIAALVSPRGRAVNNLIAAVCYVAVTVLFYYIFKPVNRNISLVAALVSLAGCVYGAMSSFNLAPLPIHTLVFFGVYCSLISYLIFNSTFLPRFLGVLMAFAAAGWLTFLFPQFAANLFPYNIAPGFIGEGALTLWLIAKGVDEQRWKEQAEIGLRGGRP